jgi:hypothetical protein
MSDDNAGIATGTSTQDMNALDVNRSDPMPAGDTPEVADLEADISRTREELAQTVDQLAAKVDVKTRVRNRVSETADAAATQVRSLRDRATDADGKPTPAALSIGGGVVAGIVAVVVVGRWIRSSRRSRGRRWR